MVKIERWLCAENYTVTKYVPRDGYPRATLANLTAHYTGGRAKGSRPGENILS